MISRTARHLRVAALARTHSVRSSTTKPKPNTTSPFNEEDLIAEITGTTSIEKEEVLSLAAHEQRPGLRKKKSKKDNTVKSPLTEPSKKLAASGKGALLTAASF